MSELPLTSVEGFAPSRLPQLGHCNANTHGSIEERVRSHELAQYFTSASINSARKTDHDSHEKDASNGEPAAPRLAPDAILTALTQLGAVKLDTARSYISLIDNAHQYVICEATRSISLVNASHHDPGDQLFIGVRAIDLQYGVCPQTLHVFSNTPEGEMAIDTPNVKATKDYYTIRNFCDDSELATRPYVTDWPHMRAYAEVPLRSLRGYVIGSYCVIDDKPRDFELAELRVLQEIADGIMQHLELLRTKADFERTQALVRGLGMYVDGYSSLQDEETQPSLVAAAIKRPIHRGSGAEHDVKDSSKLSTRSTNTEPALASYGTDKDTQQSPPSPVMTESVHEVISRANEKPGRRLSEHGEQVSLEIREAFSRASNLILESMDMQGVVFLDAVTSDVGGMTRSAPNGKSAKQCAVLSYATESAKSVVSNGECTFNISEQLLKSLLATYPVGQVFSADEFGMIPGVDLNRDIRINKHPSRQKFGTRIQPEVARDPGDVAELLSTIPEASSVLFLPTWGFRKDGWYSAAVCWTTKRTRIFTSEDLYYLSAFGNSIMAEVARVEAVATSSAKSDFISSISHELKSPLHGILAGVDLLRESSGATLDLSSLSAICSCGNMLLDTINHLLDFAKINLFARPSLNGATSNKKNSLATSKLSTVNLATLVQDVVEGLHLAHTNRHLYHEDPHTKSLGLSISPTSTNNTGFYNGTGPHAVVLTLDIDPSVAWTVRTEIGAWKRMTMNLLGNALKFTETGEIAIRLYMDDVPVYSGWNNENVESKKHFVLKIKDTGKGMSKEFLESGLWVPFVQENSLSVGTGLGLSIVLQLARGLGGCVEVDSEIGRGTEFTILVPLGEACVPLEMKSAKNDGLDSNGSLRGKTLFVPSLEDRDEEVPERSEKTRRLLADIASRWFGMDVRMATPILKSAPRDGIILEPGDGTDDTLNHIWSLRRLDRPRSAPNGTISHPFGPRTFAMALLRTLEAANVPSQPIMIANGHLKRRRSVNDIPTHPVKLPRLNPSPSQDTPHSQPLNLLLVDDNSVNLKVLSMTVSKLSCAITTATNGEEAVEAVILNSQNPASPGPFDWIFMDMSMPVMDGATATRRIRALEKDMGLDDGRSPHRAKIVALTALSSEAAQREAIHAGCDLFLSKPVSIEKVRQLISEGREKVVRDEGRERMSNGLVHDGVRPNRSEHARVFV